MQIKDLFSHKIHSSGNEWQDKLVELAFLFEEFDGEVYDRDAIEKRLQSISQRSSFVARDRSKFRDEYSAYPAYFGLYHLEMSTQGWKIKIGETARRLLLREEPDVAGFLRLQLSIFQYPNGMGAIYFPGTSKVRIQSNARDRTLDFIKNQVRFSPLRLIASALVADADLRDVDVLQSEVSYGEIFTLCNSKEINNSVLPDPGVLKHFLHRIRIGEVPLCAEYESRFHLLKHLDLFEVGNGKISVAKGDTIEDSKTILEQLNVITQIKEDFKGFDNIRTGKDLEAAIIEGAWGAYFDAVKVLGNVITQTLATRISIETTGVISDQGLSDLVFPLRNRDDISSSSYRPKPVEQRERANPEITGIRHQRRNLVHKIIVDLLDHNLRSLNALPKENQFIDLYAKIPGDGSFIFEIKSGGDNLLAQIRKGLSQLYEYRFRHSNQMDRDVKLCLVIPHAPSGLEWVEEYLCKDRGICLCWIDVTGIIHSSNYCKDELQPILAANRKLSNRK